MLTTIIQLATGVLIFILVLTLGKDKTGAAIAWLSTAVDFAKVAVKAAEGIFKEPKSGGQKFVYVEQALMEFFTKHGHEIDYKVIKNIIEGAVVTEIHDSYKLQDTSY